METQEESAPGSVEPSEADSILEPPETSAESEDTSRVVAPVPDWDAPDETLAAEGDSPPDSLLDEPIPREQQPGILRVRHSRPALYRSMFPCRAPKFAAGPALQALFFRAMPCPLCLAGSAID